MSAVRDMPADFAERLATTSKHRMMLDYSCGHSTLMRWIAQHEGRWTRGNPHPLRPMPADFADHARETNAELINRYRCTSRTIMRWRELVGVAPRNNDPAPMPEGFAEAARRMTTAQLCDRFDRSEWCIGRWRREAGIKPLRQARTFDFTGIPGNKLSVTSHNHHRDMTRAGQAADFLRRFAPVIRCNAEGHYDPTGRFWRRGSAVLCAGAVIARAERQGFRPDAWREIAA